MTRRSHKRGLPLPWERQSAWILRLLAGPRWRLVFAAATALSLVWLIWRSAAQEQRRHVTFSTIAQVHRAVSAFRLDNERCPRSMEELLRAGRASARYLAAQPVDGFGRELFLRCPGRLSERADVISAGPSGSFFVDDNIM